MRHSLSLCLTLAFALGLAACTAETSTGEAGSTNAAPTADWPASLFVTDAIDGAVDVGDLKASAKEGDVVVLRGKVGGTMEPFVDGLAVMTVAGHTGITSCDQRPGDGCPTPWDFCCDDPKDIVANTVTIQVVGDDGRPLTASLEGAHGLAPLTSVVVRGTVGPRPSEGVLVVDADAIHVE